MEQQVKIFIVDDDDTYLKSLENSLKESSYYSSEIRTFPSGEACLRSLFMHPDVVILDYYLNSMKPGSMDGIKTLARIKEADRRIKVIVLSGQEKPEIAVESIKNGATEYFVKNDAVFVKIKNVIKNIVTNKETIHHLEKQIPLSHTINLIVIIVLIVLFLLSRIL